MNFNKLMLEVARLESGEEIRIPCGSFRQAERVRQKLYRTKDSMMKHNPDFWQSVDIARQKMDDDLYIIVITIAPPISEIIRVKKDGTQSCVHVGEDPPELKSILSAMAEDGLSEEDQQEFAKRWRAENLCNG